MLGKRSGWSGLLLSSAVAAAALLPCAAALLPCTVLLADDATPAPAPAAAPAADAAPAAAPAAPAAPVTDKKLTSLADDTLHYIIVGNVQLAHDSAQAILDSKPDPKDALQAFEAAANGRDIYATLLRGGRVDELRDVTSQLNDLLEQGHRSVSRDPARIRAEVERLGNGPRAYENAKTRLIAAGQYSAPILLDYLGNDKFKTLQPYVLKVMVEIGRPLLPALQEQLTGTADVNAKVTLVKLLSQIGYPQALPAIKQALEQAGDSAELKAAATAAIAHLDASNVMGQSTASDAYTYAARGLLERKPQFAPADPSESTNPVWIFNKSLNNVDGVPVPTAVWYEISAKRAAEQALKLNNNNALAISLWLAAEFRRESNLPAGATDPVHPADAAKAEFYALAAGPTYVIPVLRMALDSNDSALALKALEALKGTAGTQTFTGEANTELVRALGSGDRAVRFTTALALGDANPNKPFPGSQRVVPVLAEAVSQTGVPNVLIINSEANNRNRIAELFRSKLNFNVFEGSTVADAVNNASRAAAFDVVVIESSQLGALGEFSRNDYRLSITPVLATADAGNLGGVNARLSGTPHIAAIDVAADDAGFKAAIEAAKKGINATPIDEKAASAFSSSAITVLGKIAADHSSIYQIADAVPTLGDAVKDKRPEIATAAAAVLGTVGSTDAERSLAAAALDANLSDSTVKAALLGSLADAAKSAGNQLDAGQISALIKVTQTETDAGVRTAAARALGALNIPSNQASTLILQQAK